MRFAPALAAAALGLSACAQQNSTNLTANDMGATEMPDPATTNLTPGSDPAAVDQAVNQTDQQSDFENVAENAANSVSNTVE